MGSLIKGPYLISRFLDTWRNEGPKAAISRTAARIRYRFHLEANKKKPYQVGDSHYQEIYNSYLFVSQNKKDTGYVELPAYNLTGQDLPVKAIAFYLPQYHPIPENDAWWGKGFTEWTNVSKAVPNFIGHYQPHLPGELGFYDLRISSVIERQVELARKFGIFGFCFYYYWFNGKRLLDLPLDLFVNSTGINYPFCLCWANENWTKAWDGLDQEVLIAQNHSPESDISFIDDVSPYLTHKRYIKINGRPLLIVYRPQILPEPGLTVDRWREHAKKIGLEDLYLVAVQSAGNVDPRSMGFDAAVEFPPHGISPIPYLNPELQISNPEYTGMVFKYSDVAEQLSKKSPPDYQLFKTVVTGWDNTARRQNQSYVFHNATPQVYQSWISSAIKYTLTHAPVDQRFVFINAWNEWAEGTHLEPDRKYGYAFLDATARALNPPLDSTNIQPIPGEIASVLPRHHDTAVILHLFYPELWAEISHYLDNLADDFDLFVSIPTGANFDTSLVLAKYPQAYLYPCQNRGRDIAPFIRLFSAIERSGYEYVCKIHTKKSTHREDGERWRTEVYRELLGSPDTINMIKQQLNQPDVGLIGPNNHILSSQYFMGGNEHLISDLAQQLHLDYHGEYFTFIAGSMFWLKPRAIAKILTLNLSTEDFPPESGQIDGTLAHAVERLIGLVAAKQHFKVIQTGTFTGTSNDDYDFAVPYRKG